MLRSGRTRTVASPAAPRRFLGLLALACAACQGAGGRLASDPVVSLGERPAYRASGPRLPEVSGGDPVARGWTKVDGLLWVEASAADAYRQGQVFDGSAWVPRERPLPEGTVPEQGFLLRTDHVSLRTDLPWNEGLTVARVAEAHVEALFAAYGEALDLRSPAGPLPVVATARRQEFHARLRRFVADPVTWGAFYESGSGAVYVSHEPAAHGPLPLEADLRHEMTHQILDLSTPNVGRARIFRGHYLWLWEGFAVHCEGLGDRGDRPADAARFSRFARRLAANDWTPLERLFTMSQEAFEGRHYDQTASLFRFLMRDGVPGSRAAVLTTLRDLLRNRAASGDFERHLGLSARDLEARWIASLRR